MTEQFIAQGTTYAHCILDATMRFADHAAIRWKDASGWRTTSYAELREEIIAIAAALSHAGIKVGDHIGIWLGTTKDWIVCDLVIQILGAVTVPVYHTLSAEKARSILQDAEVKALFSLTERIAKLEELGKVAFRTIAIDPELKALREEGQALLKEQPELLQQITSPRISPEDLSAIIYTSGTTGEPKGAMLTHASIVANARSGVDAYLVDGATMRVFLHLPMAHVVGRNGIETMTLISGGTLAIAEPEREKLVSNLKELAPTELVTVPYVLGKFHTQVLQKMTTISPLLQKLFRHAMAVGRRCRVEPLANGGPMRQRFSPLLLFYDFLFFRKIRDFLGGRARQIITGAAHISRETLEFFWIIGIPAFEAYGMTETTSLVTDCSKKDVKLTTVGRAVKGMEIKLNPDGEILIRGIGLMKGYWKRPEATHDAIDSEGWYHTGDLGSVDEQGYVKILDRKKEIFVLSTGKNVAPQAVENALKLSPLVENACVFGDKRNYMTALISPEWSTVKKKLNTSEDISVQDPKLRQLFDQEIKKLMTALPDYERVKRFALIRNPFSVETNTLTPTLKLRRKQIEELYKDRIEALYAGPQSNFWYFDEK